jgi:hypothetical protein
MRFWGRIAAVLVAVAPLIWFSPVHAQTSKNWTVTTCGTAPSGFSPSGSGYTAGAAYPQVMDINGNLCTNGTFTGTLTPTGVTSTDASGTIASGGVYQTVIAASGTRKGCLIQNPTTATEVLSVQVGTMASPFTIPIGGSFNCASGGIVVTDAITATAATTSHAFSAVYQ